MFARVLIIIVILLIPLAIIIIIFRPLAFHHQANNDNKYSAYALPSHFKKADLVKVVRHMLQDQEFAFYFKTLPKDNVMAAIGEIYSLLDQYRSKDQHAQLLKQTEQQVQSLASLFESFHYDKNFYRSPQSYPELNRALWLFFYEEFKLTVMGLCYKGTYDLDFSFPWNKNIQQAASEAKHVVEYLKENKAWPPEIAPAVVNANQPETIEVK